jgi:hypothetical protein
MKPILEVLAGVPTVVYGYFAALTVAPIVRAIGDALYLPGTSSESALAAGLAVDNIGGTNGVRTGGGNATLTARVGLALPPSVLMWSPSGGAPPALYTAAATLVVGGVAVLPLLPAAPAAPVGPVAPALPLLPFAPAAPAAPVGPVTVEAAPGLPVGPVPPPPPPPPMYVDNCDSSRARVPTVPVGPEVRDRMM